MEIHPTAIVHPRAQVAPGVRIGPYCVVDTAPDDQLNVRDGPGTLYPVVGSLAFNATEVAATGTAARDTDGRVFSIPTLPEMLTVQPFPAIRGTQF